MTTELTRQLADELYAALRQCQPIALISARHPGLGIDDAYAISRAVLEKRLAAGERLVGKKIGLTAKAVQDMLGINEPDYGFLTDAMQFYNGASVTIAQAMRNPMAEAEIALVLKRDLSTENVTAEQVLEATDYAVPCLELVDTRFETPRIRIVDTIADNASSALFVLGEGRVDPRTVNLATITCVVTRNGEKQSEGVGAAVMGSPLHSTAWLANRLGAAGVSLNAGDIVLAGSLVPLAKIAAGDTFEATFAGLGTVSARFA